jgi:hypothetical protein
MKTFLEYGGVAGPFPRRRGDGPDVVGGLSNECGAPRAPAWPVGIGVPVAAGVTEVVPGGWVAKGHESAYSTDFAKNATLRMGV